jgi:hypothetical protein
MIHRWHSWLFAIALLSACGGKVGVASDLDAGGVVVSHPGADSGVIVVIVPPSTDSGFVAVDGGVTVHPPPEGGLTPPPVEGGVIVTPVEAGGVDTGMCLPETCEDLGVECGAVGDGCGGVMDCGGCGAPDTCGGGGEPGICGSASVPIDASGAWSGSWEATTPGIVASGVATMQLAQQGATLSGSVSLMNTPCLPAAQLAATLAGGAFTGTLTDGSTVATITGQVVGNSMTGTVSNTGASCGDASGTFSLTR